MTHRFPRTLSLVLAAALATSGLAFLGGPAASAQAAPVAIIDTANQAAVMNAYLNTYLPTQGVPIGWTGSAASCNAGAPSSAGKDAILTAFNYMRAMAGLPSVTESAAESAITQAGALMMEANKTLTHYRSGLPNCNTADGVQMFPAASGGEIIATIGSAGAIPLYMLDPGAGNETLGHRAAILAAPTSQIGIGSTANYNETHWIYNSAAAASAPAAYSWPSAGYFPYELLNSTATAWSFYPKTGSAGAATVTVTKNGVTQAITSVLAVNNAANPFGAGPSGLGWTMPAFTAPASGQTDTYHVAISGITGGTSTTAAYDVKVFAASQVTIGSVTVSGTPQVGTTLTAFAASVTPMDATVSYVWSRGATAVGYGATYTPVASDANQILTVTATGSKTSWTPGSMSTTVTVLPGPAPAFTPTITGLPSTGAVLTASANAPSGWTASTYQWYRGTTPITGATGSTYVTTAADSGQSLSVQITITRDGYNTSTGTSAGLTVLSTSLSGQVTSTDGSSISGVLLHYDNVDCTTHADITSPDDYGDVTTAADGTFRLGTLANTCYSLAPTSPGGVFWTINGAASTAYLPSNSSSIAVTLNHVAVSGVTITGNPQVGSTLGSTLSSAPSAAALTYQWYRGTTPIAGATSSQYTVASADVGQAITLKATVTLIPCSLSATSPAVTGLTGPAITFSPYISYSSPAWGTTMTAVPNLPSAWTASSYQWLRNGTPISGATSSTYVTTLTDAGTNLTVTVTAMRAGYTTSTGTSPAIAIQAQPGVTFTPSISGPTMWGATMTAIPNLLTGWTASGYQWLRSGAPISGATGSTYVTTADDAGTSLAVRVTATRVGYTASTGTSSAVSIQSGPAATFTPNISGSRTVGATLTALANVPAGWAASAYQWLHNGSPITGATASTYTVATADDRQSLSVRVTATRPGYTTTTVTSPSVLVRSTRMTGTLTALDGSDASAATLRYDNVDCTTHANLTAPDDYGSVQPDANGTFTIPTLSGGCYKLYVAPGDYCYWTINGQFATAYLPADASGVAVTVSHVVVGPVEIASVGSPPRVDLSVRAIAPWDGPEETVLTYQWFRGARAITGATSDTYKPVMADVGQRLTVTVTASWAGYSRSASSAPTAAVALQDAVVFPIAFGGVPYVGGWLGATPETPAGWTVSGYQWLRSGVPIAGATGASYTTTSADLGKAISVRITATRPGYATSTVTSGALVIETAPPPSSVCVPGTPVGPMGQFVLGPDMNGDGRGEALVVDKKGVLWEYPGQADGRLGQPCRIGTGFSSYQVFASGDINSDGRPDVLAVAPDGKLYLYPGNGQGHLGTRRQVGTGWTKGWRLIPAMDLNGDKKADLLGIAPNGTLYFYSGKGDGSFNLRKLVGSGWTGWQLYAAGDLNGDGKNDILGVDPLGYLFQYTGKGSGFFNPRVRVGSGWNAFRLASGADLDGDHLSDLLGRNNATGGLYFYKGKAGGHFATRVQIATGW